MNMEVPESAPEVLPALKPQWSRRRVWLTAIGLYAIGSLILATVLWFCFFNHLAWFGAVLSLVLGLAGIAIFVAVMLVMAVVRDPSLDGTDPRR